MIKPFVLILLAAVLGVVEPHGFIKDPVARTSIHRLPNWGGAQPPFLSDDDELSCGNVLQDVNYSTCGRCGEALGYTYASQGGRYDKRIITGTYSAGQQVDAIVVVTEFHGGNFHFELCPQVTETDNCFQVIPIVGEDRIEVGPVRVRIQLPANVRCTRCTLRWTYRAAPEPDQPLSLAFRNCVDIQIN